MPRSVSLLNHTKQTAIQHAALYSYVGVAEWGQYKDEHVFRVVNHDVLLARGATMAILPAEEIDPALTYVNHSPDGLSWGYGGSGPAQCAAAILMDLFQDWTVVEPIYQDFKSRVIAPLKQGKDWEMSGMEVYAKALEIILEKPADIHIDQLKDILLYMKQVEGWVTLDEALEKLPKLGHISNWMVG